MACASLLLGAGADAEKSWLGEGSDKESDHYHNHSALDHTFLMHDTEMYRLLSAHSTQDQNCLSVSAIPVKETPAAKLGTSSLSLRWSGMVKSLCGVHRFEVGLVAEPRIGALNTPGAGARQRCFLYSVPVHWDAVVNAGDKLKSQMGRSYRGSCSS